MDTLLNTTIRLAGIEEESTVDGPGIRLVIFVQGCERNCKGCHNPETHSKDGGKLYSLYHILNLYKENPLYEGITFSGGEPFASEHVSALFLLANEIHKLGGNVVTYTGYTFDELKYKMDFSALLAVTDILIDGPFIEEEKSMELEFRGSKNQSILELDKIDDDHLTAVKELFKLE